MFQSSPYFHIEIKIGPDTNLSLPYWFYFSSTGSNFNSCTSAWSKYFSEFIPHFAGLPFFQLLQVWGSDRHFKLKSAKIVFDIGTNKLLKWCHFPLRKTWKMEKIKKIPIEIYSKKTPYSKKRMFKTTEIVLWAQIPPLYIPFMIGKRLSCEVNFFFIVFGWVTWIYKFTQKLFQQNEPWLNS